MSNSNFRWRWGETNPVLANVNSVTVVEIGDLVWLNTTTKKAEPAASSVFGAALDVAQTTLAAKFLGVAMQASPAGSDAPIRVATSGTFQFRKTGADVTLGSILGVDKNASESVLENQTLVPVSTAAKAIGRVAHVHNVEAGTVFVAIQSAVMCGGVTGAVIA